MFAGDMIESRSSCVELKDVEPDAISLLVEYSYTSQLEITSSNVQSVMAAASIFDFPFVLEATAKFLATHLHPSNCLGMRAFGRTYGSESLVNASSRHFRNHFTDAIKSEEFLQLPAEVFSELLDSDDVNVRTEEDIFRALELWLNHDPDTRKESLSKVYTCIHVLYTCACFLLQVMISFN